MFFASKLSFTRFTVVVSPSMFAIDVPGSYKDDGGAPIMACDAHLWLWWGMSRGSKVREREVKEDVDFHSYVSFGNASVMVGQTCKKP